MPNYINLHQYPADTQTHRQTDRQTDKG